MEAPLHSDEQRNKRNSVGQAYVPVHRRTNSNSDNSGGPSRNSNRISKDFSQFESDESRRSSRAGMRASMGAGNDELGYLPSSASSRRSSRNFAWSRTRGVRSSYYGDEGEDSDVTTDVSIPSTPASYTHRFSRTEQDYKRTSILEKLEALSMQEDREQDWEELLRQYDRYDDGEVANRRHSKRASRILDPFSEPPAEMPTVEEPTVILDCYDFSPAFKTHHLHDIFREYENMKGGYRIKWMDDTRALIIFEHPTTAKKAYIDNVSNPLAKIRPYNGSTEFLKGSRRPSSMDMKRMSYNGMKSPIRPTHEQRQSVRGP